MKVPGLIQQSYLGGVKSYRAQGGTVICHRTYVDPVSLLGTQTGEIDEGEVELACIKNHLYLDGEGKDLASKAVLGVFNGAIVVATGSAETFEATDLYNHRADTDLHKGPLNATSYMWSTHETDSFFYRLHLAGIASLCYFIAMMVALSSVIGSTGTRYLCLETKQARYIPIMPRRSV